MGSAELTVEGAVSQLLKKPEKPSILTPLTSAESSPGGSAMMELKMKGYPRPNIKWTKDDVGTYKAVIHNDLGECATEGKLVLAGSPQFKEPITDVKTGIDEPYNIIAKVTGYPKSP